MEATSQGLEVNTHTTGDFLKRKQMFYLSRWETDGKI